jgi:hypothetical protein
MEEENIVNLGGTIDKIPSPSLNVGNQIPGSLPSAREAFAELMRQNQFKGAENIPVSSFYSGGQRFLETRPFTDYEEMAAQQQSSIDQWRNGIGKGVGLLGTTFANGTIGLIYGIGSAINNQQFSKLYDNPVTQYLDSLNRRMEDAAPNYYTKSEQDAEWWSPDNFWTPNFFADKVIKNIGFGVGSLVGGTAWTKAFKALGKVSALTRTGKIVDVSADIEKAMQVVPKGQKLSAIENTLTNLYQGSISGIRNNGERFLTSSIGTFGEASIEALQKTNEFRNNAISEYRKQYGEDPVGEELDEINSAAEKIGNYVWGMNTVLLTGSNYIQLPKILGSSRKSEKAFINNIAQEGIAKPFAEQLPKGAFRRISTDALRGIYGFVAPSEAFEEGMQFAISTGVEDFFNRAYENREDFNDFFSALSGTMGSVFGEGIEKTLNTKEGMESLIIGALSGGIQQTPMRIAQEGLYGRGGRKKKATDIALQELNKTDIQKTMKDQANFLAVGISSQALRQKAVQNNDILSEKDYEADYALSYVMPRAKYGKMESVYNELDYYKQQATTSEGFQELQSVGIAFENENSAQFLQRVGNLETTAKAVEKHYDNINETYSGIILTDKEGEIILDDKEKPVRKYSPVAIDRLVYAASKIDDYSKRIPFLSAELTQMGINSTGILQEVISENKPAVQSVKDAVDKINALDVISDIQDNLKRSLSDMIEIAFRRKLFIEEYNKIKQNPENYNVFSRAEKLREKGEIEIAQKEGKKKTSKTIEVGKEYSLNEPIRIENGKLIVAPKLTVISETLGGEFETRLPDGREVFLTPAEFSTYQLSDEDNTSQEMEDALNQAIDEVFGYPAFRDVLTKPEEGVNKLEYVNSLGNLKFTKAIINRFNKLTEALRETKAKEKETVEKLKEQKEDIDKQQEDIANKSGDPSVGEIQFDTRIDSGETGPLKSAAKFFNSSSNESDDPNYKFYNPNPAPHIIRSRVFLNTVKNNKKRDKFRAITFTSVQEADLGLSGITELSYGKNWESNKDKVNDLIDGFVAQVYVEVDGKNRYFIDKNGDRIKNAQGQDIKVGEQVDLSKVIFETRPTVKEFNSDNSDRFRTKEKDEFLNNMEVWKKQREILFTMSAKDLPTNTFTISKGFPIVTAKVDGKYVKNKVGETILQESQIEKQSGLLKISTGDNIVHSGETMNAKLGLVYVQFRDTLQVLNNNVLGAKKGKVVYEVVKSLINDMQSQAISGKQVSLDRQKLLYLRSVLNYKNPTKDVSSNQLWIEIDSMSIKLGDKSFSFSDFINKEAESVSALANTYHTANKRTLDKGDSYLEFVFEEGKLSTVKWPNYQSYLISGKNRNVDDVPFVTNVAKTSDAIPYNYRGKYATVQNFNVGEKNTNFNNPIEPQAPSAPPAAPPVGKSEINNPSDIPPSSPVMKIGEFNLNDGSTNTIKIGLQTINFAGKGDVNQQGEFIPTTISLNLDDAVNQTAIQNISNNPKIDELIVTWKNIVPNVNDSSTKEEVIVEYLRSQVAKKLVETYKAQQPAAPEAPVSDIEAKKADIERRRQETLSKSIEEITDPDDPFYEVGTWFLYGGKFQSKTKQGVIDKINAAYDAELAAIEGKPAEETKPSVEKTTPPPAEEPTSAPKSKKGRFKSGYDDARALSKDEAEAEKISQRDIDVFKTWHAKNAKNIPFEILDNIITLTDGRRAWGVFEKGVAKFFKSGLRGTEYHEIFEGIWKGFLSNDERQAILDEFKNKPGDFLDRESGRRISFFEATDRQAKERIADDFADYRIGKLPARNLSERLRRFFKAIVDFFKSFVTNPSLKDELFNAIDSGRFKDAVLPESIKVAQPEYRKEMVLTDGSTLSEEEAYNFVQDMSISISGYILNRENDNTVENVFEFKKVTGTQAYNFLRDKYIEIGNFEQLGEKVFNELYLRNVDQLRMMGISIDAESIQSINDSDGNNRLYSPEAFEVDFKKNMKFAIKFLISSLPSAEKSTLDKSGKPLLKSGAAGLPILSNFNRTFATLLSKLSNTSLEKIPEKLYSLFKEDGNYYRLVRALHGDMDAKESGSLFDFGSFTENDWKLYIQFAQAFNKSKPDTFVESRNASIDGLNVFTRPADKASAVNVEKYNWLSNLKTLSTEGGSMIKRDKLSYSIDTKHPDYPTKTPNNTEERIKFLRNIGINFPVSAIPRDEKGINDFVLAVNSIYKYGSENIADAGNFTKADSSVIKLATIYVNSLNPDHDTTRLNVENKRTGNYSDSNAVSVFEEIFNESNTIDELLQRRPELNDVFSKNSILLEKGGYFFDKDGDKISGRILKIGVVDGITENDGGTTIGGLTEGQRFTLEINQNLRGEYYILIPADSSTERTINIGNRIKFTDANTQSGDKEFNELMLKYLNDEIELALDWRNRKQLASIGDKRAKQLRFFREILDENTTAEIEKIVADGRLSKDGARKKIKEVLDKNTDGINNSIKSTVEYLNNQLANRLKDTAEVLNVSPETVEYPFLDNDFAKNNNIDKNAMSIEDYNKLLSFINMNQMIASTELHKFIFGDPYQFKTSPEGNLDATKRFKSWLSPRRKTFDSKEFNDFLNEKYNTLTDGQELSGDDITRHNFKSYVTTVTLTDPKPISRYISKFQEYEGYEGYDESDGFSLIQIGTFREVKLKNAEWTKEAEDWYQWQMAYARQKLSEMKKSDGVTKYYDYKDKPSLKKHDEELIKKKEPYYVLEVLKPIVSGAKPGLERIEGDIDKFSQMPVFFKAVEGTALQELYAQMLDQGAGYVVYKSGRKEGARGTHNLYKNGKINTDNFSEDTIEEIAWSTYGIQVENTYEEGKKQTRVSQLMKNVSMDMFQNGKAVMVGADKILEDMKKNHDEYHDFQYQEFLNKLGIQDLGTSFEIVDAKKVSETLEYELLRREASENTIDTIRLDENGKFRIPFEASSAYEEIQRVLYSIINKSLISPTVEGKPYVQVPATGWENKNEGRELIRKIKTTEGFKYETINQKQFEALSEEDKKTVSLASSRLKFYENEDGKRHMEVMIPNYWKKYFKGMSDQEVLNYLNKPENQKILFGVGARIPHQAMSSTEIFKVVGFLHPSMGSTIVVPSEIVKKAGSDFDIDKLNTYLKAVYLDENNNVKLVEYKGSKEATMDFYGKVYDQAIKNELEKIEDGDEFRDKILQIFDIVETIEDPENVTAEGLKFLLGDELFNYYAKHKTVIDRIQEQAIVSNELPSDYIGNQIGRLANKYEKLTIKQLDEALRNDYVNKIYKKSLENKYFDLIQQLVTLPENFERLMSPVSDAGLPAVAKELDKARGDEEGSVKHKLLSKSFLTSLRHAFVLGKKWVGIVAVNITGHAIAQKTNAYVDPSRLSKIDKYDASFLGDMTLAVPHNTITVDGEDKIALGGRNTAYSRKDKKGEPVIEFISDRLSGYATAVVDVAKDPFIMRILKSDLVVGTAMFMERIGVGELTPFFLNQPIISDYLKYLDKIGSRGLFSNNNITEMYNKYPISAGKSYNLKNDFPINPETGLVDFDQSKANLLSSIDFNAMRDEDFNLKQHAVLKEFLKLAKMAQYSFKFTQAYNYDTTRVRTTEGVLRKALRTDVAQETNIISSVNDVFAQTFIGKQRDMIIKEVKSLSAIFKLDNDVFYNIIDEVLKPFASQEYMSLDDFDRVVKKIKTGMIDYLVQTKSSRFSKAIVTNLISGNNNIGKQLSTIQKKYPENELITNLETRFSKYEDGGVTVTLKSKPSDAATTNRYIAMMRELKALEPEFYKNLVLTSLIQGTYDTRISINKIVPLEDRAEIIAPLINASYSQEDIQNFSRHGVFFRTNFSDNAIVPEYSPKFMVFDGQFGYQRTGFIKLDGTDSTPGNGKVLRLSKAYSNFNNSEMDFLKVKRYQYAKGFIFDITGERKPILWKSFKTLIADGQVSMSEMVGYKKVKDISGQPLTDEKDNVYFKMVNLYGDGDIAKVYRVDGLPSTIKNNTYPVKQELSDDTIIKAVNNEIISSPERIIEQPTETSTTVAKTVTRQLSMQPDNIEKIKSGRKTITNRKDLISEGLYKLPDGTIVNLTNLGRFKVIPGKDGVSILDKAGKVISSMPLDEFAQREGFSNWEDFKTNNKYSESFINDGQIRNVYSISIGESTVAQPTVETSQAAGQPSTPTTPEQVVPETPVVIEEQFKEARIIQVNQYEISVLPDGRMFFSNGKEVEDQTIKNKVNVRKELQDKTLRISTYNKSEYFVLSDDRIVGSGKTNLGKETVTDPDIKKKILMKAVLYKKTC